MIEELSKTSQFCLSRANIPDVARRTTMGDFQKVKERFGDGDHDNLRTIPVEIHEMGTMYFETYVFSSSISDLLPRLANICKFARTSYEPQTI